MLRAPTHRLYGRPHVLVRRDQIPPGGQERSGVNLAAFVDQLRSAGDAVTNRVPPRHVAIAFDDGVRAAERMRLLRVQRRVDPAEDDPGPALARDPADFVAAQRVACVNADPDDVAGLNRRVIQHLQRFVRDERIAELARGRRRKDVKPSRRNDTDTEREMAGIDQVHLH